MRTIEKHTRILPSKKEVKDYNVMIDGKNFFGQPVKSNMRTYNNIRKIETGEGDDYTTGCLLDYNCFSKHYEMIAIDLRKQRALDADPKQYNKLTLL